jgi:hypothetical protein
MPLCGECHGADVGESRRFYLRLKEVRHVIGMIRLSELVGHEVTDRSVQTSFGAHRFGRLPALVLSKDCDKGRIERDGAASGFRLGVESITPPSAETRVR